MRSTRGQISGSAPFLSPLRKGALGVVALGVVVFVGWLGLGYRAARATAREYVRTARLSAIDDESLELVQLGLWHGFPATRFACFGASAGGQGTVWIVLRDVDSRWRVVELASRQMPTACEGGE